MPLVQRGLLRFAPSEEFSACTAATLGDARDDSISDPREIITKLHAIRGHDSANRLGRVVVNSDGGTSHLLGHVDEVLEDCDLCRAFAKAPHVPIAGTSAVPMFHGKVRVDLLFLGDLVVAHVMDVLPNAPFFFLPGPRILRKSGMSFVGRGWAHLALPSVFRWVREGSGRMRFGRIPALRV